MRRRVLVGLFAGAIGAVVWLIAAQLLAPVIAPLQEGMMAEVMRCAADLPWAQRRRRAW